MILVLAIAATAAMANGPAMPPQDPDINEDGIVNIFDLVTVGYSFGDPASNALVPQKTSANGNITVARVDLDWSGWVDWADLDLVAKQFGMTKPQIVAFMASIRPDISLAISPRSKLAATWGKIKVAR
ncbi:MAG: hypothetical protein AUJ25_01890 [Parcubacteria group bacterium CG1_02_37_13]|nr:MAG: hypothetical protein AUJ25_01890 [Parcubacteria group bacterium CG1_02_37_13]